MAKIVKACFVLLAAVILVTSTPAVTYACDVSQTTCPCPTC